MQLEDTSIGQDEIRCDVADAALYQRLAALLDHDLPPWRDGEAPPLGHWLNFHTGTRQSELGPDGHPRRAPFPGSSGPLRRMWAGGRLQFPGVVPLGAPLRRRSTMMALTRKAGRTGPLIFVTARQEIFAAESLAVIEEQDLVFREAATSSAPDLRQPEARKPDWSRSLQPDAALLFRYSALTYNSHRIHYDADYVRTVEGYPGLVVHGPLLATVLLDLFLRHHPAIPIVSFRFRAESPLFAPALITLAGKATETGAELWAMDAEGRTAVNASVIIGGVS